MAGCRPTTRLPNCCRPEPFYAPTIAFGGASGVSSLQRSFIWEVFNFPVGSWMGLCSLTLAFVRSSCSNRWVQAAVYK